MMKICRCERHDKFNGKMTEPYEVGYKECIYTSRTMQNAQYINPDGSIDPDAYANAKAEANYQYRKSASIEFYKERRRKGK